MAKLNNEIAGLPSIITSLPSDERELVERILDVNATEGKLDPPEAMNPWITERFGSVDAIKIQQVVRVTNRITLEETLFNPLRSDRPQESRECTTNVEPNTDIFKDPLSFTPADTFGRVEGKYCITAGNVAKYDGLHGLIVFAEPDPLRFSREQVADYVDTAWRWAQQAQASDAEAKYFLFMWNCGYRAGASLLHGHAQVLLTRKRHYAKVENLRCQTLKYLMEYKANYFDDLYKVHHLLGCGLEKDGVRVIVSLTPIKEKEVYIIGKELNHSLKDRIYEALACLRDRLDVSSFNLILMMPPIAEVEDDWQGFPVIVRIVDRGDDESVTSDIGTMELYASSVVSCDPFKVTRVLRGALEVPEY